MESSSPHNGLAPSTLMSAPSREPLLRGWVKWSRMTSLYRSSSAMCLRSLHSLPSLLSLPRHSRLVKIDPAVDWEDWGDREDWGDLSLHRCRPWREQRAHRVKPAHQSIDITLIIVQIQAGPRRGRHAQPTMQGLRAVMSGPHGDAFLIQDLRHVMRVHALQRERHHPAAVFHVARTKHRQSRYIAERVQRVGGEPLLV